MKRNMTIFIRMFVFHFTLLSSGFFTVLNSQESPSGQYLPERFLPETITKKARLQLPFLPGVQEIEYQVKDGVAIMDGDIVIGTANNILRQYLPSYNNNRGQGSLQHDATGNRWTNYTIPYSIASGFPEYKILEIRQAVQHLDNQTNLILVERTYESDYVEFTPADFCASSVGKTGGRQLIYISDACGFGEMVHELCHAAGLLHEHSRYDRDNYVEIMWNNIGNNMERNFKVYPDYGQQFGTYDYGSIMHYHPFAFAKCYSWGCETIKAKDESKSFGQRKALSRGDIEDINKLYPANTYQPPQPQPAPEEKKEEIVVTKRPTTTTQQPKQEEVVINRPKAAKTSKTTTSAKTTTTTYPPSNKGTTTQGNGEIRRIKVSPVAVRNKTTTTASKDQRSSKKKKKKRKKNKQSPNKSTQTVLVKTRPVAKVRRVELSDDGR